MFYRRVRYVTCVAQTPSECGIQAFARLDDMSCFLDYLYRPSPKATTTVTGIGMKRLKTECRRVTCTLAALITRLRLRIPVLLLPPGSIV